MAGYKIKYSLPELKQIVKENNIKGTSLMNKPEILKLLVERGRISIDALAKPVKQAKIKDANCARINPKKVFVENCVTGEQTEYASIYKASRALGISTKIFVDNNGKIWRQRYRIDVASN